MTTKQSLSVIILSFNEAIHIRRAVQSALTVADDVLVVDSHSTDSTVYTAREAGARVLRHKWVNYATQFNWALCHGDIHSDWVMRLDADEYLSEDLARMLQEVLRDAKEDVGAFEVNLRIIFLGKEIRHGGGSSLWLTRLWRNGWAHCENRWMDEHIVLERGSIQRIKCSIIHHSLKTLSWWIDKHNGYATREALDVLRDVYDTNQSAGGSYTLNRQAARKRLTKVLLYEKLPMQLRAWAYFAYRIIVRIGFLDGPRGILYHTLQGLWYRLLVDAKLTEVLITARRDGCSIPEAVERALGVQWSTWQLEPSDRQQGMHA